MATTSVQLAARRKAIFAACRQLGIDEDTRHEMLRKIVGVSSTKALDLTGCAQVLEHLRKVGAARAPKAEDVGRHPGKPAHVRPGCEALLDKIEAQLASMALSWNYAGSILRRVSGGWKKEGKLGKEDFRFAEFEDLKKVVAALAYEQKKRAMLEQVTEHLRTRGIALDDARSVLPGLPDNWQRNTRALQALLVRLAPMPEPI